MSPHSEVHTPPAPTRDEEIKKLIDVVTTLRRENHSIRARLSAVQDQIQEINQVTEILLVVQQQIMSSIGGSVVIDDSAAILAGSLGKDDEEPN